MKPTKDDLHSGDLQRLGIEPVEVSRARLNSAGGELGKVSVSLSRIKFGETETVDTADPKIVHETIPQQPRIKRGSGPTARQLSQRPSHGLITQSQKTILL